MTTAEKMQALINSFPCLSRRGMRWSEPTTPQDNSYFIAQCRGMSSGERQCAAFILHVWNWRSPMKGWRFDFGAFINACDDQSIEVVREWMLNPWYA